MREKVVQRGVRADEAVPGTGLGLAIVRDLAELYEGSIELGDSSDGGLCARLQLPAAAKPAGVPR
jgi:signal transduction histidine kinase